MSGRRRIAGAFALLAVAGLPWAADLLRAGEERCALDGVAVAREYRVRVDAEDKMRAFCGVRCAEAWLARSGAAPRAILVTDGATSREIDAGVAWFVRTLAARDPGAPDPIRVFASREEAERRVAAYGGRILAGPERPFGKGERDGAGR